MTALIESWAGRVGTERACAAFGVAPRTWRHHRQQADGRVPPRPSRATLGPPAVHPARIPDGERKAIRELLCSPRFCDLAPAQAYPALLDEGVYVCSIRQMYRILAEDDLVGERRRGHRRTSHTKPRVHATGPNQVWTWDISRLAGPRLRSWFYLDVVIDIYSRCIVGWAVADVESDKVARRMIRAACGRHGVDPDTLTLHSDRGAQMTSNSMAELLEELGVTRSLSRPRVSNDNPYSEAGFKTAKYRPDYPNRFATLAEARSWARRFVRWYNHEHYHSGVGLLHPAEVHQGNGPAIRAARQTVLDAATRPTPNGSSTRRPPPQRSPQQPGSTSPPSAPKSTRRIGNNPLTCSEPTTWVLTPHLLGLGHGWVDMCSSCESGSLYSKTF